MLFKKLLLLLIFYRGFFRAFCKEENLCSKFKNSTCTFTVILDLSTAFVNYNIFENNILNFLFQYNNVNPDCDMTKNALKIVSIDGKFSAACGYENGDCINTLFNLPFEEIATEYTNDDLIDDDSTNVDKYSDFLNKTLFESSPCNKNSVLLLTNRIVNIEEFVKNKLETILEDNCQFLYTILLGRNESDASTALAQLYSNVPNVKFLNLPDYDCLMYLYYCINPCKEEVPQCVESDVADCAQAPDPASINGYGISTSLVWYILSFSKYNMTNDDLQIIFSSIISGIQALFEDNPGAIRIKFILNSTYSHPAFQMNHDDTDLSPIEDFLHEITMEEIEIDMKGNIGYDGNEMNNRFKFAPTLEMLQNNWMGIPYVIALTNYASTNFIATNKKAVIHVYSMEAYEYYSQNLTFNSDELEFQFTEYTDKIFINPADVNNTTPTEDSSDLSTFTFRNPTTAPTTSASTISSTVSTTSTTKSSKSSSTSTLSPSTSESAYKAHKTSKILIICGSAGGGALILITAILICNFYKRKQRKKQLGKLEVKHAKDAPPKRLPNSAGTSPNHDEWELTWDKLILKNFTLGSGAFGEIIRGKLLLSGIRNGIYEDDMIDVAIKTPQKTAADSVKGDLLNEIGMMKFIGEHKNIVQMIGCITVGERIALILEFCRYRDLHTYCKTLKVDLTKSKKIRKRTEKEFLIFAWQILNGMKFLASKGIIHRDIAARNILISADKIAKISDFGLSIHQAQEEANGIVSKMDTKKLPIKWMAIESLKSNQFSLQSDIWSFGIMLIEMYSFGEIPFAEIEPNNLIEHLEAENRLEKPEFCPAEIYLLMIRCWHSTPTLRPRIEDLTDDFSKLLEHTTKSYGYLELLNE